MSNRDPEARYERPEQAIPFAIEQAIRSTVHSHIPGQVLSYDPETKRATVQPLIRTRLSPTDAEPDPPLRDKSPILDVPVRQNATGGHMEHHQIDRGDVVVLQFMERGIDAFKSAWARWASGDDTVLADPARGVYFDMRDAMAVPWGVETIIPVRPTGWLVQNRAGTAYVSLDGDTIRLVSGDVSLVITPGGFAFSGGGITHNGTRIDDTHTHGGVAPGGGSTGTPN